MVSKFHLVKVYFDRRTAAATDEWFKARFAFFRDYTLKSITGQRGVKPTLWVHCDPGMEDLVAPLREFVPPGTVFTFMPYGGRPLAEFREEEWARLRGSDYVYITRVDSDDLLAPDALAQASAVEPNPALAEAPKPEALIFQRGYLHDVQSGELSVYTNSSSPFHTLVYPKDLYLDPDRYRESFVGDHSKVRNAYPSRSLPDWKFCVLIHGRNFLSTMNYAADRAAYVERCWSVERFLAGPVVFDVDDFCDDHGYSTLADLDALKAAYPNFKATLFTIPAKTGLVLLRRAATRKWLEIAVHGMTHEPNEEMKTRAYEEINPYLRRNIDWSIYTRGFRPPGWYVGDVTLRACNDNGMWLALHDRDRDRWARKCEYGYYCCGERAPYWHGHTHDVCNNWLHAHLPQLLKAWPKEQPFSWVSEAVLVPQHARQVRHAKTPVREE